MNTYDIRTDHTFTDLKAALQFADYLDWVEICSKQTVVTSAAEMLANSLLNERGAHERFNDQVLTALLGNIKDRAKLGDMVLALIRHWAENLESDLFHEFLDLGGDNVEPN